MDTPGERTHLLTNENLPSYVLYTPLPRRERWNTTKMQYWSCILLILTIAMAVLISMILTLDVIFSDHNSTNTSAENFNRLWTRKWPIDDKKLKHMEIDNSTEYIEAMESAKKDLETRFFSDKFIQLLPVDSASYRHQRVTATSPKALAMSNVGQIEELTSKRFWRNRNGSNIERACYFGQKDNVADAFCGNSSTVCDPKSKYRSFDGSCNNLKFSDGYGVAFRAFRRALPADYADGISEPRASKSKSPLPSARSVSRKIHRPLYIEDHKFTVMLAVWGQFLDHDITATALSKTFNGSSISCCVSDDFRHFDCFPVLIDRDDPLQEQNVTCMEFVRSLPAPTCCLGTREQLNQATSFIDGSVIYGIEDGQVKKLREFDGGRLKMLRTDDGRSLLPVSDDLDDGCNREDAKEKGRYCFDSGDSRANENLLLTSMHTVFARHHNNLVKNISKINPHWNDEKLFQEARKIIGAQMQHITYKEFLPVVLGTKLTKKFDLIPLSSGYFKKYNESVDPTIANHFAASAFRFAHSIIPGLMQVLGNDSSSPEFVQMHRMLFNPFPLYEKGAMDRYMKGAVNTSIEANDPYFTTELKNNLFEHNSNKSKRYGLDLVSLNIQRGRDHGLPSYTKWRQHCGLRNITNFEDLSEEIDPETVKAMQELYGNIEDVDLYTGAISEKPLPGGILGATKTCLILDQFYRLKYGDRFWYENEGVFSPEQLREIRKSSLAKILCDSSDNLRYIQPKVMEKSGGKNGNVPCKDVRGVDLMYWKDMSRVRIPDN